MLKINNKEIKAIFFDLDGTLIDTEPIYNRFWREAVASLGHEMSYEQALSLRSLDNNLARELVKSYYNDDIYEEARSIRKKKMNEYLLSHPIKLKVGTLEVLKYLKEIGVDAYVVTATRKDIAMRMCLDLGITLYLKDIISTKDVKIGKPHPDVYLEALKCSNYKNDEVLAVEDSPNGIKSIYNANIKGIFVPDLTLPDIELLPFIFRVEPSLRTFTNYLKEHNI